MHNAQIILYLRTIVTNCLNENFIVIYENFVRPLLFTITTFPPTRVRVVNSTPIIDRRLHWSCVHVKMFDFVLSFTTPFFSELLILIIRFFFVE